MKRTCRCGEDGDAAVFGPCYRCTPKPDPSAERDGPVLRDPYDMDDDERRGY